MALKNVPVFNSYVEINCNARSMQFNCNDYKSLNFGKFLNDNVVNLWMILLSGGKFAKDIIFHDPLLFTLIFKGNQATTTLMTKTMDIVPIVTKDHWSLIFIVKTEDKKVIIGHLDPMLESNLHKSLLFTIVNQLMIEKKINTTCKNVLLVKRKKLSRIIPQQTNGTDCGVFVNLYACFLKKQFKKLRNCVCSDKDESRVLKILSPRADDGRVKAEINMLFEIMYPSFRLYFQIFISSLCDRDSTYHEVATIPSLQDLQDKNKENRNNTQGGEEGQDSKNETPESSDATIPQFTSDSS